jgi:hypothetical protein
MEAPGWQMLAGGFFYWGDVGGDPFVNTLQLV